MIGGKISAKKMALLLMLGMPMPLISSCNVMSAGAADDYTKTPVLFVHGRGLSASSFSTMIKALRSRGYPSSFLRAIDLVPNDGPNVPAAEKQIAPFVARFLAEVNADIARHGRGVPLKTKIDIVAHSMGSVSSRWYAAKLRPERVNTWISIAGPNHGSSPNCPGLPRSGKADLCPAYARTEQESYVQFHLNGAPGSDVDETPYGAGADSPAKKRVPPDEDRRILYLTLRTPADEFIVPNDSTVLDGAGGVDLRLPRFLPLLETSPGNFITQRPVSHDWLLYTDFVIDFVYAALNRKAG